jgi:hypothetical protein
MTTRFKCGAKAKYSGTYRCRSCGASKTMVKGRKLIACKCGGREWELTSYTGKVPDSDKDFLDRLFG